MAYPMIDAFLRRAESGVRRINQRGASIGAALQPFAGNVNSYFGPLQSQEASLGSALNQSLAGTGQAIGSQIGGSLAANQAPAAAISQYGGGAATMGAQAGGAIGALSSADLQKLRSTASAEAIYASALPRLAALASEAEKRSFLADASEQLAELAAQESERAYGRAQDEREWKRQMRQDRIEQQRYRREFRQGQRDRRYDRKQDRLERERQAKMDRLAQEAAAQEYGLDLLDAQQEQQRINLAIRRQNESEAQFAARERRYRQQFDARMKAAAKSGKKPNASLSAKYGYIVDSNGRPILTKNGKRIPVRSDSAGGGAPWGG